MSNAGIAVSGFTLIEIVLVLGIVAALAAIAVPNSVHALRQGAVGRAATALDLCHNDANRFARSGQLNQASSWYGVRLVGGPPPHRVEVFWGPDTAAPAIDGLSRPLNPGVLFYDGAAPLATNLTWFYQHGTGFPLDPDNATGAAIAIGTSTSPVCTDLSIRSTDGTVRRQVKVFEIGLLYLEEF